MPILVLILALLLTACSATSSGPQGLAALTPTGGTTDIIRHKLTRAVQLIDLGQPMIAKVKIRDALALMPTAGDPPGGFVTNMPFQWDSSEGPMRFSVVAMLGDGTPQPNWAGTVMLNMLAYGRIVGLYDAAKQPIPCCSTPQFMGSWQGYIMLETSTGKTQDLGLKMTDPISGIAGGSHAVRWIVPSP